MRPTVKQDESVIFRDRAVQRTAECARGSVYEVRFRSWRGPSTVRQLLPGSGSCSLQSPHANLQAIKLLPSRAASIEHACVHLCSIFCVPCPSFWLHRRGACSLFAKPRCNFFTRRCQTLITCCCHHPCLLPTNDLLDTLEISKTRPRFQAKLAARCLRTS